MLLVRETNGSLLSFVRTHKVIRKKNRESALNQCNFLSAMVADMARNAELAIETVGMSGGREEMVVKQKRCGENEGGGALVSEQVSEESGDSNKKKAGLTVITV
jgi:hypothetical protein